MKKLPSGIYVPATHITTEPQSKDGWTRSRLGIWVRKEPTPAQLLGIVESITGVKSIVKGKFTPPPEKKEGGIVNGNL